jgi:hypothetical protein
MPPPPERNAPARPLRVERPFYIPGEYMAWELSWRGITGGKTQLVVGQPGTVDGRAAIIIRSESRSDGVLAMFKHVRDDMITTIDLVTARPMRSSGAFEFGTHGSRIKASKVEATFRDDGFDLVYRPRDGREQRWSQQMPAGEIVYDTHSVLGVVRAWEPVAGEWAYFYAVSGRRLYRVEIAMAGREPRRTVLGEFASIRIEGTATRLTRTLRPDKTKPPRRFTLWMSDDSERLPILIEARTEHGDVRAEMSAYERETPK